MLWLQAGLVRQSVKCAPEPRTEEMPSRVGRVKAGPVICRRVISESGTALLTPLMPQGMGGFLFVRSLKKRLTAIGRHTLRVS